MTAYIAAAAALALMLAAPSLSSAQTSAPQPRRLELRLTGGAFVPTAGQRGVLGDAHLSAAQLSWRIRPSLAATGTVGWARSRDLSASDAPKLDVFTADVGLELRAAPVATRALGFAPFAGAGVGARRYDHRSLDANAATGAAGYAAVGAELGVGRVGVRLEVRDYATRVAPLAGAGAARMRNDVTMMVALRLNRRPAPRS